MSEKKSIDRIASLDLLRLVAALAVVLFHYLFRGAAADGYLEAGYPAAAPYAIYGYLGVNLFFLISGFVIAWSAEGRSWQAFALARFARLYPGFLVCMAASWAVLAVAGHPAFPVTGGQLAANAFIFSTALGRRFVDGVYWSIVLEIIFYGWVTLAILAGVFTRFKLPLIAGWLFVCAANELWIGSHAARLLFVTEFGPFFASGMLVHHIFSKEKSSEALMMLATAFVLSCCTMLVGRDWMLGHYGVAVPIAGLIAANVIIYALLIGAVALHDRLPASGATLLIGGLTYPLYLLHQNAGYVAINGLRPSLGGVLAVLATIALMLLASWAVWRFVERPARRWILKAFGPPLDRIASRLKQLKRRQAGPAVHRPAS
ncbi:MAG: acyltransferase [Rhizobiales bacterium]|nr:acyltransferase [Hyphomicrobiales bacterium]